MMNRYNSNFTSLAKICIVLMFMILVLNSFYGVTQGQSVREPVKEVNSLKSAKENALNWLKKQMVPNAVLPEPSVIRKNFVLSYNLKDYTGDNKYLYGKSSLYDNAIAAIAFTMCGDYTAAESILSAVLKNRTPENDLWFAYNTQNEWPDKNDNEGAVIRTGASAWFCYAVVFYLEIVAQSEKSASLKDNYIKLLSNAEMLAGAILKRQITDRSDIRYGLITGGDNQYQIVYNEEKKSPQETFIPGRIEWISTEHNLDAYFFLNGLHRLTGKDIYKKCADEITAGLLVSWNDHMKQMARGRDKNKFDYVESLDCASWGSMFLRSSGHTAKAEQSLVSCGRYSLISEGRRGYRPYINLLIYEEKSVNSRMYPDDPGKNWNDLPLLWHEGSLGVAMALLKGERTAEAKSVIDSVISFQKPDGGIPYANITVPYQFTRDDSVASAAWLVMTITAYEDKRIRDLFWK